nr:hypothetical protein [Tanacetum cinerariifolium]
MNVTLHIDGQSTEVDVPPNIIIDVVDEDDDITDDEDILRHDLAESDNEDLINVDDDSVDKVYSNVARSHGGDGGGEDRPLYTIGQAEYPRQDPKPFLKGNHRYERPHPDPV